MKSPLVIARSEATKHSPKQGDCFAALTIPVLKSSVVFSWHVTNVDHSLGATAGLSSSVFYPCTAGQASSGAHKSIGDYFLELLYDMELNTFSPAIE